MPPAARNLACLLVLSLACATAQAQPTKSVKASVAPMTHPNLLSSIEESKLGSCATDGAPGTHVSAPTGKTALLPVGVPSKSWRTLTANGCQATRFADWVLKEWPDPDTISEKEWEYTNGIVLWGVSRVYLKTRDPRYLAYVKAFVDKYVDGNGNISWRDERSNLDYLQPCTLLPFLYDQTQETKYQKAAQGARQRYDTLKKNADGGFWHKEHYPNEMWVDSIFMASPFLVSYGKRFGDAAFCNDTAVLQVDLLTRHAYIPEKHLVRHAWDFDKNASWADPATGLSPEFWSRGTGWYAMALVDILTELPTSHPGHGVLKTHLQNLAVGLKKTQDPASGLWHQVLDKGKKSGNWLETSGSAMFVYALKTAADKGWIDASYKAVATKGWKGLQARISTRGKAPKIAQAVDGMGVQDDYQGYVSQDRRENSPHVLCAIMLASSVME